MSDFLVLGMIAGLCVLTWGLIVLCEQLQGVGDEWTRTDRPDAGRHGSDLTILGVRNPAFLKSRASHCRNSRRLWLGVKRIQQTQQGSHHENTSSSVSCIVRVTHIADRCRVPGPDAVHENQYLRVDMGTLRSKIEANPPGDSSTICE